APRPRRKLLPDGPFPFPQTRVRTTRGDAGSPEGGRVVPRRIASGNLARWAVAGGHSGDYDRVRRASVRDEELLQLADDEPLDRYNFEERLNRLTSRKEYGTLLGQAVFRDSVREAFTADRPVRTHALGLISNGLSVAPLICDHGPSRERPRGLRLLVSMASLRPC